MAAHEHLNPVLFHGSKKSDFEPGDLIHPMGDGIDSKVHPVGPKVHSTPLSGWASMYGYVYRVEPTDSSQLHNWGDTEGMGGDEYVSTAPMKVVRREAGEDAPEDYLRDLTS
jgi:hypothetical protein